MTDDAEAPYLSVLYTSPLLRGNAMVVLCGEDAHPRLDLALELFRAGAAPRILLSGGLHHPPHLLGASHAADWLVGEGVHPESLTVEDGSTNTREQALNTVAIARDRGWQTILLVASIYHLPRATLSFIHALEGKRDIRWLPIPVGRTPWTHAPAGMDRTRRELAVGERGKILEYGRRGHCATYRDGLDYLLSWEL